ncbi:O-antigen polysaccharide polymerase Wzy [Tepidibacter mesophilus]|uniref:O-antigen polysaccharide polymerase Wzy n=1 Tax=Tepidibacter mesophilus TaxID=655607 RepID=UPI000C08C403|nr:O-antigen polysaccharide polymerase Wzy [Tepidibacter mesophilus]
MRIKRYKINIIFITISVYSLYALLIGVNSYTNRHTYIITLLSWIGIISYISLIITWEKVTGKLFTLYNIFMTFFMVFNFGQCLLWAFNIHVEGEIGTISLFGKTPISDIDIIHAQLLYIVCFFTLNCGAIIAYKIRGEEGSIDDNNSYRHNKLYITSVILSIIVIPITYYIAIYNLKLSQVAGYRSLYYGEYANRYGPILNILSTLFLPCLLGLLLGSRYRRSVRKFVYGIFGGYAIVTLLCGDRGEWIMKLLVLLWAEHKFYRKKLIKDVLKFGIVGYIGVHIMNAIVSLRNIGLSMSNFMSQLFSTDVSPIVSLLKEFGNSMTINIVIMENIVRFPYGNSYLMSILTMPTTGLVKIFGVNYVQLNTWFSGTYLGISYGIDFTIIAEAVLNHGKYIAPLVILIIGFIVSKIDLACGTTYNKNPLKTCLMITAMAYIFKWPRTTTWYVLNSCFYSMTIFISLYCILPIKRRNRL